MGTPSKKPKSGKKAKVKDLKVKDASKIKGGTNIEKARPIKLIY